MNVTVDNLDIHNVQVSFKSSELSVLLILLCALAAVKLAEICCKTCLPTNRPDTFTYRSPLLNGAFSRDRDEEV